MAGWTGGFAVTACVCLCGQVHQMDRIFHLAKTHRTRYQQFGDSKDNCGVKYSELSPERRDPCNCEGRK